MWSKVCATFVSLLSLTSFCSNRVALEIIHRAGWVHRDISGGNLYSYSFAGTHRGLIGDFEFAKREAKEEPYRIVVSSVLHSSIASHLFDSSRVRLTRLPLKRPLALGSFDQERPRQATSHSTFRSAITLSMIWNPSSGFSFTFYSSTKTPPALFATQHSSNNESR